MNKVMLKIDLVLARILAILMVLMVVDVTWQVVTRFLLSQPSSFTEEIARFLLIWIGVLGAAYAYRKRAHLGLDLLTSKMPPAARRRADVVANLCCFGFAASVMVFGGIKLVALTLELRQTSAALQIPIGYIYTVIPISGVLICLYALHNILQPAPDGLGQMGDDGLPVD